MDIIKLHSRAGEAFGRLVDQVSPATGHSPTPDTDWDVHDLVNHVVVENLWVPPLLAGQTIAEVGTKFDGDMLGDDPKAAWHAAWNGAAKSFAEPGALEVTVHLSFGDTPAKSYAEQMFIDLVIHGWDLAKGIGASDKLDPELAQACYDRLLPQAEGWRSGGAFGPAIEVASDADLQTKLLALAGRQA